MMMHLGQKVQCVLSGFTGIVTARCEYINGCVQCCVLGQSTAGSRPPEQWVDEPQLKAVKAKTKKKQVKATGGPQSTPQRLRPR